MKSNYREELTELLQQASPGLAGAHDLEFKNVFGAVACYVNGKIFITCGKFGVAIKLPSETLDELFESGDVGHLRYFPKGHIKKEYAVLPERLLRGKGQFRQLLEVSIRYVNST